MPAAASEPPLVEALVERGATVVATSRNHQNPTTQGRVHHRQLDVADLESLQPFVAQVIDEFGSLDLVLPNAGIAPVRALPEIDLTTWQETLTVNLTAPFLLAQAALPDMVNRGSASDVTSVPASTLNTVGLGSVLTYNPSPIRAIKDTTLISNGKPEVLYIGAEFCPYCAAERWAIAVALSRFDTLSHCTAFTPPAPTPTRTLPR